MRSWLSLHGLWRRGGIASPILMSYSRIYTLVSSKRLIPNPDGRIGRPAGRDARSDTGSTGNTRGRPVKQRPANFVPSQEEDGKGADWKPMYVRELKPTNGKKGN